MEDVSRWLNEQLAKPISSHEFDLPMQQADVPPALPVVSDGLNRAQRRALRRGKAGVR